MSGNGPREKVFYKKSPVSRPRYQLVEIEDNDKPALSASGSATGAAKAEDAPDLRRRHSDDAEAEAAGAPPSPPNARSPREVAGGAGIGMTPRTGPLLNLKTVTEAKRDQHIRTAYCQVATYATEPAPRKTVTDWNESFVIGGLEGNGCLAFTISDHLVTGGGANEFMGQATLQLEKTAPMQAGSSPSRAKRKQRVTSTFTPGTHAMENLRLPLGPMRREVDVERGKGLQLKNRERVATGELYCSIRPAPSAYSVCSRMLRRVELVLTSYSWKPSWVVLAFGFVRVYNARGETEPRFELNCDHVIGVGYDVEEDTINISVVGDKDYSFRVIVNEHKAECTEEDSGFIRRTWLRKLRRVCPKITTNEFCQEEMSHDAFVRQGDLVPKPRLRVRRGGRVLRT